MENLKQLFDLSGKKALITGSSQGIGKHIAITLASFGAEVFIHYNSDEQKANETLNEIKKSGGRGKIVSADLTDKNAATLLLKQTGKGIDVLVLNASIQIKRKLSELSHEDFEKQYTCNYYNPIEMIKVYQEHMKEKKWGRIITVGSVQQRKPHPEMLFYSSSKAALYNSVMSLAPRLAPFHVTINNIAPGAIDTMRNKEALSDAEYKKIVESKIPAGYIGQPEDCSGAVLLLASEAGRYITGENIFIDGGMHL